MLQVTKIFQFEMAHAIHGYQGSCGDIHGHTYQLHVTVSAKQPESGYLRNPGFIMDFKDLKELVQQSVIDQLEHRTVLSEEFLDQDRSLTMFSHLVIWKMEPTAENLLLYISHELQKQLPENIQLKKLKIFETAGSYAEWEN
jgi:6-pyruvoyltetrahydropterin/6-carboxytetrahydropterin synthase